jgi:hypothetical protein
MCELYPSPRSKGLRVSNAPRRRKAGRRLGRRSVRADHEQAAEEATGLSPGFPRKRCAHEKSYTRVGWERGFQTPLKSLGGRPAHLSTPVDSAPLPFCEAYVEQLKEQALAKLPKNPPPPALALQSANQDTL